MPKYGAPLLLVVFEKLNADFLEDDFDALSVDLKFVQSEITAYKQLKNEFVGGLSIIDVLMFNSKTEVQNMLKQYTTI